MDDVVYFDGIKYQARPAKTLANKPPRNTTVTQRYFK